MSGHLSDARLLWAFALCLLALAALLVGVYVWGAS